MSLKEPHEECRFYFYTPELAFWLEYRWIRFSSVSASSLPGGAIADRYGGAAGGTVTPMDKDLRCRLQVDEQGGYEENYEENKAGQRPKLREPVQYSSNSTAAKPNPTRGTERGGAVVTIPA